MNCLATDHIGNVFTDSERVKLRITTLADADISITDYNKRVVFEGVSTAGEFDLDLGILSRNHYTVEIKTEDKSEEFYFAVIPSVEKRPQVDSAIASDVAMSWLVRPERFDDLAQLTKLAGIIWVRDRISWGEVETERSKWADQTRYDLSADIQTKHGLRVYQVFHATPGWAQAERDSHSFPDDLRDVYNFAFQMAQRFKGKVPAWEVWNEPDISVFSNELGDSYSALLKAMYLGFKSADPELLVLICSFAMGPGEFAETIFQNDVNDYFDIYNYHIYDDWKKHVDRALKHLELMRKYGVGNKPIWLTEAGRPVRREPDLLEVNNLQGQDVAEFLPKAIIASLSVGVDKYFWFIMPYYRERDVMLFGLLRGDMTPTAGYCSMSACTYALGKAKYLGHLDIDGIYTHVFERTDDEVALAFWTDSGEKTLKLKANTKKAKLVDLMGVEQEISPSDNVLSLKATPSVEYLILPAGVLEEKLVVDYPKEQAEVKPYDASAVSPVVLRLQFPKETRDKKAETYMLKDNQTTVVGVEVCNFGNEEIKGKLEIQFSDGWLGALDDQNVAVSTMGRIVRKIEISRSGKEDIERSQIRVNLINLSNEVETYVAGWIAPATE